MPTREEVYAVERFGAAYGIDASILVEMEQFVLGSDYGANGYTTMAQANLLSDTLDLQPTDRLLDIGAGRGWPGLYLAVRSGCSVVVTDLTVPGMLRAQQRIRREGISSSSFAVVASGRHLPFAKRSFYAVVHSDTLC